jgi:hypothetical protein
VADRQHLHHRLLNIGHSYRQSVLIMYLWAALFSVTVVSLSLVRSPSVVFAVATLVAVLALLPVTMPRLRPPWVFNRGKARPRGAVPGTATPRAGALVPSTQPATRYHPPRPPAGQSQPQPVPDAPPFNPAPPFSPAPPFPGASRGPDYPDPGRVANADPGHVANADPGHVADHADLAGPAPGYSLPRLSADSRSRPPRRPSAEPFVSPAPFSGQAAFPRQPPFNAQSPFNALPPFDAQAPFNGEAPFPGAGPRSEDDPVDWPDSYSQAQPPDTRPS